MAKKWERNFQPMVEKAKQKRSQAFKRTDEAIKLLIKEGRRINFNTVAEVTPYKCTKKPIKRLSSKGYSDYLNKKRTHVGY